MTYNERVQAIAKKMAMDYNTKEKSNYEYDRDWIHYLSAARIAVAEMAKMATQLYYARFIREGLSLKKVQEYSQQELKEQGLIPDTE